MNLKCLTTLILFVHMCLLSACSLLGSPEPPWVAAVAGDGPGDPALLQTQAIEVKNLPKSRSGNRSRYSVFGQEYEVMDTAKDFKEWGVASWYGKKFHGRATSSGEIYDMHQMSAAHKHLPLPTFVRVTRIDNGESIIVKVNDRGPFVEDRSIDLSYAAAVQLGMLNSGKTDVYIEALSTHEIDSPDSNASPITIVQADDDAASLAIPVKSGHFVQVGAYSDKDNAARMVERLRESVSEDAGVNLDPDRQLYRVRIGPLASEDVLSETLDLLASAGIDGYKVIVADP
ncbi:MAG: septal ring lytic transglycosylase RlpA family protein [Granulosicoccus sp.]